MNSQKNIPYFYNINYKVTVDSCHILGNTPLIERGADVTLRDSKSSIIIRTTNNDNINLTGLTSNTYYKNWEVPIVE